MIEQARALHEHEKVDRIFVNFYTLQCSGGLNPHAQRVNILVSLVPPVPTDLMIQRSLLLDQPQNVVIPDPLHLGCRHGQTLTPLILGVNCSLHTFNEGFYGRTLLIPKNIQDTYDEGISRIVVTIVFSAVPIFVKETVVAVNTPLPVPLPHGVTAFKPLVEFNRFLDFVLLFLSPCTTPLPFTDCECRKVLIVPVFAFCDDIDDLFAEIVTDRPKLPCINHVLDCQDILLFETLARDFDWQPFDATDLVAVKRFS